MFDKLKEKWAEEKEAARKADDALPPYTPGSSSDTTHHRIPSSSFQTRFASLSLHTEDKIRFLRFPAPIIDVCRSTIRSAWPKGIQEEKEYAGSHEFKLEGYPWRGWSDDANLARRLMKALLAALHQEGWVLTLNSDVSKTTWDKDTMLFRHQVPTPAECDWMCVAFSKNDRVRFLDAPPEVYEKLPEKFGRPFLRSHSVYAEGIYEFRFDHNLWWTSGTNTMKAREVLLILIETLESEGWMVYASINQKNGGENYSETDTWHCYKPKGWTHGDPVFHK